MASPFRALGRGLRGLVLPLVGFWELRGQLETVSARLAALEDGMRQAAERDARLAADLAAPPVPAGILSGLAELAGGLGHKVDLANDKLDRQEPLLGALLRREPPAPAAIFPDITATLVRELDRLDGYLLHHVTMLRGEMGERADALQAGITALREAVGSQPAYVGAGLDMVIHSFGFDVVVPTAETGLLLLILRGAFGTLEPGLRAALGTLARPGAVVVDVGANIGVHALPLAAAIGPAGRITCFEPVPEIAAALARSMRVNGFAERATVHCAALAEAPGEASFNRAAHSTMSSLYPLPAAEGAIAIPVTLTTLDAAFPPGARLDLVKMDAEGAEPRIWRGMRRVLRDNPQIAIAMEWSASHFHRTGEDPAAFLAEIRAAGFTAQLVEDAPVPGRLAPLQADAAALEGANLLLTRGP